MERYGFGPAPRRLRAQLRLDYADGSHEWVVTGPDWRLGASPILKSDIYNGETIDARPIGSTSCRERVSQYVSIPGGGGSFKQKNNSDMTARQPATTTTDKTSI